jgi:cytochrome c-type biogenesis protein CcmI
MSVFCLTAACILLGALLCLLLPLIWLAREQEACVRQAFVASICFGELAAAHAGLRSGDLSREQFESVCQEVERHIVEEGDGGAPTPPAAGTRASADESRGDTTALLLIALVPTVVLAIFLRVGETAAPPVSQRAFANAPMSALSPGTFASSFGSPSASAAAPPNFSVLSGPNASPRAEASRPRTTYAARCVRRGF